MNRPAVNSNAMVLLLLVVCFYLSHIIFKFHVFSGIRKYSIMCLFQFSIISQRKSGANALLNMFLLANVIDLFYPLFHEYPCLVPPTTNSYIN